LRVKRETESPAPVAEDAVEAPEAAVVAHSETAENTEDVATGGDES
jgi:hypothetical protein